MGVSSVRTRLGPDLRIVGSNIDTPNHRRHPGVARPYPDASGPPVTAVGVRRDT